MSEVKNFVLDTNVLLRSPRSIYAFEENNVYITQTTLEELDNHKSQPGENGYNAREAIREIKRIRNGGNISTGVKLPSDGMFAIIPDDTSHSLPVGWDYKKADNRIIASTLSHNAILVTSDIAMLLKAESAGAKVEIYRHEQVSEETMIYTGRTTVNAMPLGVDSIYQQGFVELNKDTIYGDIPELVRNEFVTLQDVTNPGHTALGYYDGHAILKLKYDNIKPMGITPRNAGQRFALEALLAPVEEVPLVILRGPAGVAKTFLALAAGLQRVVKDSDSKYNKILMFRPNIKFDDDIGYLKGDEMDKIRPLIRPFMDNLEELLPAEIMGNSKPSFNRIDKLFESGILTAEAMAYLRGRSIHRSYIICDEAQNSSPNQMKGILTRAGIGSKLVIMGDPEQIDNPRLDKRNNGLVYAAEKMMGNPLCMQLAFDSTECVRSPLAQVASELL